MTGSMDLSCGFCQRGILADKRQDLNENTYAFQIFVTAWRLHSFPCRHADKFPPRDQLDIFLNQNLAKLIAVKKIEIALPPSRAPR
jgi:hypothetical protein